MTYTKQLLIIVLLIAVAVISVILYGYSIEFTGCGTEFFCLKRLFTSVLLAPIVIPLLSLFISIIPLFFLKEQVYKSWRKFAIFAIPVIAIFIFLSPTRVPGDYITLGFDREVASMLFSIVFLVISWCIAIVKTLKTKR